MTILAYLRISPQSPSPSSSAASDGVVWDRFTKEDEHFRSDLPRRTVIFWDYKSMARRYHKFMNVVCFLSMTVKIRTAMKIQVTILSVWYLQQQYYICTCRLQQHILFLIVRGRFRNSKSSSYNACGHLNLFCG